MYKYHTVPGTEDVHTMYLYLKPMLLICWDKPTIEAILGEHCHERLPVLKGPVVLATGALVVSHSCV